MFDRQVTNKFLNALNHIEYGVLTLTDPDRKTYSFQGLYQGANAFIDIHDWSFIRSMLRYGDTALAEAYRDGLWNSSDLVELFLFGLQNQATFEKYIYGGMFGKFVSKVVYFFQRNTINGSKKNIHAHYNLGNDFYALWLDPTMTYSSAIFSNKNDSLINAQKRKYNRILERLKPSGTLLEIGCGWGGFAEHALKKGDYRIKGLTISKEQYEFASRRIGSEVVIALEDYRFQEGIYDQIVSIEMFEAVGEAFWSVYFSKIKSLLAKKGKFLIQTITINDTCFKRYKNSGDPIRSFVFPGGMLPSSERLSSEIVKAGLRVTDKFAFGQDYVLTLMHWLNNFERRIKDIKSIGFDEKFIYMWRFYLSYCIAAFKYGRVDVVQWELQHEA
ncbi:S-adenosyl-L-methionine dependent methyltransferase [Liberibacter crescens BT-1]|uniref:S-adenosyl-L-methionine dependent methyltransferase n=1 Tax=Liberibacter crescens (strain BT-1) TaxID=1215343 RepID=L0ETM6_LIBCB|nr:cyclopropane-fatty-acyl-phospholipid synthase family protein [Liberibacter crescens]AGA64185.1 S-adenosyl-L-methionine dependent methyltransferase [Liberibacter crescens BT-1]AMC12445.1 cyclopropane-fatty-acyl-phospholipid synthase [Liberibacter crescens]